MTESERSTRELISGWGRSAGSLANRVLVRRPEEIEEIVARSESVVPRGLGRSYGDAAQLAGGTVIDCTELREILSFDLASRIVRLQAGCSFAELLNFAVPRGFFVPVTPGTAHVTLGGAVAADVHGKNHHRDGSIARYVRELQLVAPDGRHRCSVLSEPKLFAASIGGMGMTGIITELSLELLPIESAYVSVDTDRTRDLESCMEVLSSGDEHYRYSVAWLDGSQKCGHLGRSVITRGDHADVGALGVVQQKAPLAYHQGQRIDLPVTPPISLVRPATLAVFNEAWYRRAPKHKEGEVQSLATFFYPLDLVGSWNRLYGPSGFMQYQFVVPFGQEDVVRFVLEHLQRTGTPSSLAVLKRFGESDSSPLSFPIPGWTLALDIPLGQPSLAAALDACDERVVEAGGRVYLAKDGRLRPEYVPLMYPRVAEFLSVCREVDPKDKLSSDLMRRLGLKSRDRRANDKGCQNE